jgi:hypothetical protein
MHFYKPHSQNRPSDQFLAIASTLDIMLNVVKKRALSADMCRV